MNIHSIKSVFALFTRIPVKLKREPDYSSTDFIAPFVGLFAGIIMCMSTFLGLLLFGNIFVAITFALLLHYLLFNLFHLDGLGDTMDAIGTIGDRDKRLKALKDSRLGLYGVFAVCFQLIVRLASAWFLLSASRQAFFAACLLAPVTGRLSAMLISSNGDPAEFSSLAKALGPASGIRAGTGYIIAAIPAALLWSLGTGLIAGPIALLSAALISLLPAFFLSSFYKRNFGGFSGDALGAGIELTELLVFLVALSIFR